jgi:hypothetical protein
MADDIAVTPGAGATLGADLISAVLYVRNKLIIGADGVNDGDVCDGNPMPVRGVGDLVLDTLTLDTSAYADGDVMADTQALASAVRVNGGRAILQSLLVFDEDDQGQTFDVLFFSANRSLGTENSAPNISDANARDFLGSVRVSAGDYLDLGGVRVATIPNIGLMLEAAGGSTTIYYGTIIRGAATYTATGVRLGFGLIWL